MDAARKRNSFTWFPRLPEPAPASRGHVHQVAEERLLPAGSGQPARPVLARQHTHFLPWSVTGWMARALSRPSSAFGPSRQQAHSRTPSPQSSAPASPALLALRKVASADSPDVDSSSETTEQPLWTRMVPAPGSRGGFVLHEGLREED